MAKLVEDYKTMPHERGEAFFKSKDGGMLPFFIKYIHYCLLGIDPSDEETFETLFSLYYGYYSAKPSLPYPLYFFHLFGPLVNALAGFSYPKRMKKVADVYENCPALANFDSSPVGLTKREFAEMLIPLFGIAATQGPKNLLETAMGHESIPVYREGVDTASIKTTDVWDTIDLKDKQEVYAYLLECGRLRQPVGTTHRVATEEFTVKMLGRDRTFPKGTIVTIPINMSCVNKNVYGETTFKFDHKRPNIVEDSCIFQSHGTKHAGRMCPGWFFAMEMLSEVMMKCGEVRR